MRRLFFDHALLPDGWARRVAIEVDSGVIRGVAADADPGGCERIDGHALPGLPNLHSHTFQRAMAGLTERRGPTRDSFWTWREVMYRFLARLTPDDVEAIAAFAFMEMLERGFTSVTEFHYLHHDCDGSPFADLAEMSGRIAAAALDAGIGLTLLPSFYAYGGFGAAAPTEGQRRFLNDPERFARLVDAARTAIAPMPDAALGVAPHSLRAVSPEMLREVVALAPEGPIHIHAAEQIKEVDDCLAWSGRRPVEWLLDEMAVDRRWCLVHATHMTRDETARLARSGAVAGLCPLTEANLGDGVFNAPDFLAAGGRYGIGTDSNIEITAPGELKQLEYGQRLAERARNVMARDATPSTGQALYEAALAGGAQASGRRIAGLAPGCRADLAVLDPEDVDLEGLGPDLLLDRIVFAAGARAIRTVLVGGATVVTDGRHVRHDAITRRYRTVLRRLLSS